MTGASDIFVKCFSQTIQRTEHSDPAVSNITRQYNHSIENYRQNPECDYHNLNHHDHRINHEQSIGEIYRQNFGIDLNSTQRILEIENDKEVSSSSSPFNSGRHNAIKILCQLCKKFIVYDCSSDQNHSLHLIQKKKFRIVCESCFEEMIKHQTRRNT